MFHTCNRKYTITHLLIQIFTSSMYPRFILYFLNISFIYFCFNRSFLIFYSFTLPVPPEKVKITRDPQDFHAGQEGRIICESSSSNPAAEMSWWKGGISVPSTKNGTKPGLHGGFLSYVELSLDLTEDMNCEVYTCQARNAQMERSIHDAITLHVLCEYIR